MATVMGLCLQFLFTLGPWMLVCYLVAYIIAKKRKVESNRTYLRRAMWVAVVISVLAIIPNASRAIGTAISQKSFEPRYMQIIKGVIADPNFLTPKIHEEFWSKLIAGGLSPEEINELRIKMTGTITIYQSVFWQDALKALRTGQPYKSPQRADYEAAQLKNKMLTLERINANDVLMTKIASREPVTQNGQTFVFSEDIIESIIMENKEVAKRVDNLFTHQQK